MERGYQTKLAKRVGVSDGALSLYLSGKRRPSWTMAKLLAKTTNTTPELWLDGSPSEIRLVLNSIKLK